MKVTSLSSALALALVAACSNASVNDEPQPDAGGLTPIDLSDFTVDDLATPLPPAASLEIGPLQRTQAARSLFTASVTNPQGLVDLIAEDSEPLEVAEQVLVTRGFGEVTFAIELSPPTGRFTRRLISDVQKQPMPETTSVLCSYVSGGNNYATHDPKCKTATPAERQLPASGPLTTARWTFSIVERATGEEVATCEAVSPTRFECALEARGDDAEYRVTVAANGVTELWNASAGLGVQTLGGHTFAGALAPNEYKCLLFNTQPDRSYCTHREVYDRFTGLDTASLELDPLITRVTSRTGEVTSTVAALTWDAGDADLPGAH